MKLRNLRVNHFKTPLGMYIGKPVFSWIAEDTPDKRQKEAEITVKVKGETVFSSGKREDISSLGFQADFPLSPRTRYDWTVTVWGDCGDSASASSYFETAKENEPWEASFITADFPDKNQHPLLSKEFSLTGDVVSARAYVCGLGLYELYVNGEKAGDEYLLPGYNCYDHWLEYQTFDLTKLLHRGKNAIGLALAPGWYKGDIVFDRYHDLYGDTMKAICELRVTLSGGEELVLGTDESWKSYPSPVTFSGIYDGEHIDMTKKVPGWCLPSCGAPAHGVKLAEETTPLIARIGPKIVKKKEFAPVKLIHTPKDETVLDFGQNMTGWVEFNVSEPVGSEVRLSYGEVLQEDCFYRDNLRSAKAEFIYISDGEARRIRPHFTFYGFRYVKVEGISQIKTSDFTACHIRSDIDPIGSIETDNPRVNQLFKNAMWGQFDNFLDVPTDCPQRDERLGWTGDAAVISSTACKNIYMPAFFHHFIVNVGFEQSLLDGAVPVFVPVPKPNGFISVRELGLTSDDVFILMGTLREEGAETAKVFGDFAQRFPKLKELIDSTPESERAALYKRLEECASSLWLNANPDGTAIWSDVATLMPSAVYENYGDVNQLREEYPVMKSWVEFIRRQDRKDGDRGLWLTGMQLGDWLSLDTEDLQNPMGATDTGYIASVFYYISSTLTSRAAKVLGYDEDAAEYEGLAERIKKAVIGRFFTPEGEFTIEGTQTACVLSLYFKIYPEGKRDAVARQMRSRLEMRNWHLDTGFCGSPFLCMALSENGMNDLAYTLLLNDDFPSWLYEVDHGATTIWERWNSILPDGSISGTGMNSLNHYAYGSIADWMYRYLCGLSPAEDGAGYKRALIRPMPDPRIREASLCLDSASGIYRVRWHYDGETLRYEIDIPFDCEAEIILPDGREDKVCAGHYEY